MTQVRVQVSMQDPSFGPTKTAEFPYIRYDSGPVIYEEALVEGQYLGAYWSAMGRPSCRQRVQDWLSGQAGRALPLSQRLHAFQLEVNGQALTDRWQWKGGGEAPATKAGCCEAALTLRHELQPVEVEVHTRLDGTAVLTRWLVIRNAGDHPLAIARVDPWSGLLFCHADQLNSPFHVEPPFTVGRFQVPAWAHEGQFAMEPVPAGGLVMESRTGLSGYRPPFFLARSQVTGEAFVGSLAYSGNWRLELACDDTLQRIGRQAALYFRFGLAGPAPLRVLEAGEQVVTPAVHLGMCFGDLDTVTQHWHGHVRASVLPVQPAGRRHLVECNHTGYTRNAQMNEEGFLAEVETAAAVGCELFLVDAGWFGDASGQWDRLQGDWTESALLPRGLKPVFEHARTLQMRTGLWMAIENVALTSQAARAHPDWLLRRGGRPATGWSGALDLSQPEVARHVEDTIAAMVERFELDVYRIDGGPAGGDGPDDVRHGLAESTLWRYYDNLYRVIGNLQRRFPDLLLENCSGGGGRLDLGMMSRFYWTQTSDNWSPGPALKILNGTTLFLPPEACMTLLGAISSGISDLDFSLRTGLFNHFCMSGAFPSMARKNDWALARWRHATGLFKRFCRPMLDNCRVFHHTPFHRHDQAGDWLVLEYAAADGSSAYAGLWRLLGSGADDVLFLPRGLRRGARYRVRFDNTGESIECGGTELWNTGLRVRLPGPMTSELLLFEAI